MMVLKLRILYIFIDDASDSQTVSSSILTIAATVKKWVERSRHGKETLIWIEFLWAST